MLKRVDAYAAIVGAALLTGWFAYSSTVKDASPATDFFSIETLNIPDFVEGNDPVMSYSRTIKQNFFGTYIVEIVDVKANRASLPVCINSGSRNYTVGKKLPNPVTLGWFVNKDCGLKPGQYIANSTWKIEADGYPPKSYDKSSNVFRVIPKGGQLYVDPKIIEQLQQSQELLDNPTPPSAETVPLNREVPE